MSAEPEAPLGRRIAEITFAEADTLAERVIRRYRAEARARERRSGRPARRRVMPAVAVAAALLALLVAGLGVAPALAGYPLVSPVASALLRTIGVSTEQDRVASLAVSGESSGHTITALAGFADSTRTEIVVEVAPPGGEPVAPTLTDAAGAAVPFASSGFGDGSHVVLEFGPLPHPAAGANALMLHVDTLVDVRGGKGAVSTPPRVTGDWTLRFSLPYEADALAPVPQGHLGRVNVTFTSLAASATSIHVRFTTDGATLAELLSGSGQFRYELLDPTGRPAGDLVNSNPSGKGPGSEGTTRVEWDTLYTRSGSGTYRLILKWDGGQLERDLQVR